MTETTRLEVGSPAPDFTLHDQDGDSVTLSQFRGRKVIVYFYPEAMTEGCSKQACDFRDNLGGLQSAGYEVLGISRDPVDKLKAFEERDGLTYRLLSDPDRSVHEAWGVWGEKNNYGRIVTGVIRSTFVIDEDGTVALPLYNVRATGHVASLRKKLKL